ncbi:MAG: copper chaperone PCu(A)C, partial [Pseudomonadota bacterium]
MQLDLAEGGGGGREQLIVGAAAIGDLSIAHAWARPNIPNRPTAGYYEITNGGSTDDQLLSASSPAFGKIELHRSEKDG